MSDDDPDDRARKALFADDSGDDDDDNDDEDTDIGRCFKNNIDFYIAHTPEIQTNAL